MDPIQILINQAVQHEVSSNKNPYLTLETIILRLYMKISNETRVSFTNFMDKTILFGQWHEEILSHYDSLKFKMSSDEKIYVERVLSKDTPNTIELTKFAICWYKYDPLNACKWFAVDGILGTHPKAYVNDAFSLHFMKHNNAVRCLYTYFSSPEKIREIVETAFAVNEDEPGHSDLDPDVEKCVGLYADMVGNEEMTNVAVDRRIREYAQLNPSKKRKRTKTFEPHSP